MAGPNGTTSFIVSFAPAAAGSRSAAIHIANNDTNEAPFDINLTGTGITALENWATAAGVSSGQAGPLQIPQNDGVTNLAKFAFNLNPTAPDVRMLTVGAVGTAGLPGGAVVGGKLRIEFVRRRASTNPGITYMPQFSSNIGTWDDFIGVPTSVTTLADPIWERVVVDDPVGLAQALVSDAC